jgi:hypothetical protein
LAFLSYLELRIYTFQDLDFSILGGAQRYSEHRCPTSGREIKMSQHG